MLHCIVSLINKYVLNKKAEKKRKERKDKKESKEKKEGYFCNVWYIV